MKRTGNDSEIRKEGNNMARLALKSVYKRYLSGFEAVKNFSIEAEDGELLVLAGPEGCGKTTLLRVIAGLEDPASGEICLDEVPIQGDDPRDRGIAMIFRHCVLYPQMSAFENIRAGLRFQNLSKSEGEERIREAARVLGIEEILSKKPQELTDLQRRYVMVGRAIVRMPELLLLDEPLHDLEAEQRLEICRHFKRLQSEFGITTIWATRDLDVLKVFNSRTVLMNDGAVQQVGLPGELYENPANDFVAGFVGREELMKGETGAKG